MFEELLYVWLLTVFLCHFLKASGAYVFRPNGTFSIDGEGEVFNYSSNIMLLDENYGELLLQSSNSVILNLLVFWR